ncbi:MAG: SDR family oxidoreductase [Anaerolineae bacterium]|nr:SDR family oxidoreductase [Anaerolineae bacterium]
MTRIALITGANRGIGFEACRQLAQQGAQVILTSRNVAKGQAAANVLRNEGLEVTHHQLDVTDVDSVIALREEIDVTFGRLDILINNAGIYLDEGVSIFDLSLEAMRLTQEINFWGPFHLCRAFVPMMRLQDYGRIVNVSSGYGAMADMGARTAAYRISKLGLNALTRIVADEVKGYNIKINSMCPGWVNTDMGGAAAPRTVEQGVETITWLATLPDDGPTGGFFRDGQPIPW